jgi:hypothetical protein
MAFAKGLGGYSPAIAKRLASWIPAGSLAKKVRVNKRWDITIGLAATGVAILGLISSIATSNRDHFLGTVGLADQEALLIVAAAVGAVTALKWWLSNRGQRE